MRNHNLDYQDYVPRNVCNFGITEGLAAIFGGEALLGGAAAAGAADAGLGFGAELGADAALGTTLLPEIPVVAGAGAADFGAGAATAGGAAGGAGVLGGVEAAVGGANVLETALGTSGAVQPGSVPAFNVSGASAPLGGLPPIGAEASAFTAPPGVSSPLGPDPTAGLTPGATPNFNAPIDEATLPPNAQPTAQVTPITDNTPVDRVGGPPRTDIPTAPNVDLTQPQYNPQASAPNAAQPNVPTNPVQSVDQLNPGGAPSSGPQPANLNPGATPPGAEKGFLDKLVSGAESSVMKNPLGIGLGAAGLGYAIMSGQQMSAAQRQMQTQASNLNAQGQQLMSYLTSGTLPPGLKASLDQATKASKARVVSNYAAQGMNADPTKNSALAQQLSIIDQAALISTAQIGQQLATTGVAESGLASNLYTSLANLDATQTANVGKAIASMAAAFNSGGTKIQIGA